jgi:hypothetical protein
MKKKYTVRLTSEERIELEKLVSAGTSKARKLMHAHILLEADADGPNWADAQIRAALGAGTATIERVRKAFVEGGLPGSLNRKRRSKNTSWKLDGDQEAHLLALACSPAPKGHDRWTLRLLADKMVKLEYVDTLSYETVRQVLKKRKLSLG